MASVVAVRSVGVDRLRRHSTDSAAAVPRVATASHQRRSILVRQRRCRYGCHRASQDRGCRFLTAVSNVGWGIAERFATRLGDRRMPGKGSASLGQVQAISRC